MTIKVSKQYVPGKFCQFNSKEVQVIARELEKIEKQEGAIRVRRVLELARRADHPLHAFVFGMSDEEAAESFRREVIRNMCRTIEVKWIDDEGSTLYTTPMNVSVRMEQPADEREKETKALVDRAYRSFQRVCEDPVSRQDMIDSACVQLRLWREKYKTLQELAEEFKDIDAALARLERKRKKAS